MIDGLVLTFLDVTPLNRALERQAQLVSIVESSQDAIVGRSFDGTHPDLEPGGREDVRLHGGGGARAPDAA